MKTVLCKAQGNSPDVLPNCAYAARNNENGVGAKKAEMRNGNAVSSDFLIFVDA